MSAPAIGPPRVGVGCLLFRDGKLLLVRRRGSHGEGTWSTPGGHLDPGESPAACAARETAEEIGIAPTRVEFVALTNDIFPEAGKHYVTIWMRGDPGTAQAAIREPREVSALGWFAPDELPTPLFVSIRHLLSGQSLPPTPVALPAEWRTAALRAPAVHGMASAEAPFAPRSTSESEQ